MIKKISRVAEGKMVVGPFSFLGRAMQGASRNAIALGLVACIQQGSFDYIDHRVSGRLLKTFTQYAFGR